MRRQSPGNGSGKFDIGAHDMGGWVRVIAGSTADSSTNEVPLYLARRLAHWLRDHPERRLLCVVPIQKDGTTVELHAWYDQHVFPDKSQL
jgi:hypothetical protein